MGCGSPARKAGGRLLRTPRVVLTVHVARNAPAREAHLVRARVRVRVRVRDRNRIRGRGRGRGGARGRVHGLGREKERTGKSGPAAETSEQTEEVLILLSAHASEKGEDSLSRDSLAMTSLSEDSLPIEK